MNFATLCRNAGIKPQKLSSLTEGQEWIAPSHKGLLHLHLGIPETESIPRGTLERELEKLKTISADGGELTPTQKTLEKEILFALNTPTNECMTPAPADEDALFRRNLKAMREGQTPNSLRESLPPGFGRGEIHWNITQRLKAQYGHDSPKVFATAWKLSKKVEETMDDDADAAPYKMGDESDPHVQSYKTAYGTHPPANMGIPPAGLSPKAGSWWMNNMWRKPDVDPKKNESLKEGEKHVPIGGFWELDPANVVPQENKPTKKYDINDLDKDEIVAIAPKAHKKDPTVIVPVHRVKMGPNQEGRSYRTQNDLDESGRTYQVQPQDLDQMNASDTSNVNCPNKNSGYNDEEENFEESFSEIMKEETGTDAVSPISTPNWVSKSKRGSEAGIAGSESLGMTTVNKKIQSALAELKAKKLKENGEPEAVQVDVGEPEVSSDEVDVQQMLSQLTPEEQAALVNDVLADLIGNEEISVDESNRGKRYTKHASPPKSSVE